jgi:hypothetical protein
MTILTTINRCRFVKGGIYFFIATLIVSGCKLDPQKNLVNDWVVTSYKTNFGYTEKNEIKKGNTSYFRFYANQTYSQMGSTGYTNGLWKFDEVKRLLQLEPKKMIGNSTGEILTSYYYINNMKANTMQLALYRNLPMKPGTEENYITLDKINSNAVPQNDPFNPINNEWRKKPSQPESETDLKNRTKAYLNFLKTYFTYAIDNKLEVLNYDWYPEPILMHYSNGARMANTEELSSWYQCFYDTAQAVKAYTYISTPFMEVNLKKTPDRFERNLDIIEQILKKM